MRFLIYFTYLCSLLSVAQSPSSIQLSSQAKVSILTCAPGQNELYSQFGHSAMRIKDPENNIDKVYNYGTFDFDTPNFYLKFTRGQLLYELSVYDYKYFPYRYYIEKRWVKEQILNLTTEENQQVFDFLEWNALPENKKYYYDFFYDNCANKMYEVIEKSIGNIQFDYSKFPKDYTHRDLIHQYLAHNSWGTFGIDLALGAVIDKKATFKQYMFLPDYVHLGISNSTLNNKAIVAKDHFLLPDYHLEIPKTNFFISPIFVSLALLFTSLYFLFIKKKGRLWFYSLSILYGITGLVIFALWFLTDHSTTKMNFNILWANPLLMALPFVSKQFQSKIIWLFVSFAFAFVWIAAIGYQIFNLPIYLFALGLLPMYYFVAMQK
ncbi:Lnb N-terminal periplasmic domain-containing protein [Ochrovirga pacifica]|uniref:Lnb N-terminal periplasmic domain-containing protein n=1 Tax=Ochrovirga pacifica TaxID=1042376 RepID=UPI0002559AD8|nr:DUF4105 domain-containing protein [Ochrovirga pacifica]